MNGKLRIFGLGLLAAVAMGAVAAMNASATVSGHFTHDAMGGHAVIKGTEGGEHQLKLEANGKTIECAEATSEGTVSAATTTTLSVAPVFNGCQTEGGTPNSVTVDPNGCGFAYHSSLIGLGTFTLECGGEELIVTHPNCEIALSTQTVKDVFYSTTVSNPGNKHELTLSMTVTLNSQYEGGICVFLGTSHQLSIKGSSTLAAFSTSGEQVNLTAT